MLRTILSLLFFTVSIAGCDDDGGDSGSPSNSDTSEITDPGDATDLSDAEEYELHNVTIESLQWKLEVEITDQSGNVQSINNLNTDSPETLGVRGNITLTGKPRANSDAQISITGDENYTFTDLNSGESIEVLAGEAVIRTIPSNSIFSFQVVWQIESVDDLEAENADMGD